jgi:hypothetical protein
MLFNPLSVNLSVIPSSSASSNIKNWDGVDFICGSNPLWSLAGYALFRGHYASNNISNGGNPLILAPPITPSCVTYPSPSLLLVLPGSNDAVSYTLLPTQPPSYVQPEQLQLGMNADTEFCSVTSIGSINCGGGNGLFGYWNTADLQGSLNDQNATTTSKYFHYFSAGQYTLVVEDAWGEVVYSYFQVDSS